MLSDLETNEGGNNKIPFPNFPPTVNAPFPPISDSKGVNKGFDVDALVKKIDAKIAELEEEERQEKEKNAKNNKIKEENNISIKEQTNPTNKQDILISKPNNQSPKEKIVKEQSNNQPYDNDYVTDDQLFDDFFSDEEY